MVGSMMMAQTWSTGSRGSRSSSDGLPFVDELTPTTRISSPYMSRAVAEDGPGRVALLGRHMLGEYLATNFVKVKNTFIDGFKEEEDEEEGPPMMHIRTCPERMYPMKVALTPPHQATVTEEHEWGLCGLPEAAQPPVKEAMAVQGLPLQAHTLEEADRQPEWSLGSSLHDGKGSCRPCAWFWKPQGCSNGADCGHCHLCPQGELKARKKIKVKTMRATASA